MKPTKWCKTVKPTHTSPSQPPLGPTCSCLCCENPEKSGTGLPRQAWTQAAWWISEHHAQGSPPPGGQGQHHWGRLGTRQGSGRWEEGWNGASLECEELPVRISVFPISYCQRPISPAQGPCQCDKRAADDSRFSERQDSPLPPPEFGRIGSLPSSAQLLIIFALLLKIRPKAPQLYQPLRNFPKHPTASLQEAGLETHPKWLSNGISQTRQPWWCAQRGHHESNNDALDVGCYMPKAQDEIPGTGIPVSQVRHSDRKGLKVSLKSVSQLQYIFLYNICIEVLVRDSL